MTRSRSKRRRLLQRWERYCQRWDKLIGATTKNGTGVAPDSYLRIVNRYWTSRCGT